MYTDFEEALRTSLVGRVSDADAETVLRMVQSLAQTFLLPSLTQASPAPTSPRPVTFGGLGLPVAHARPKPQFSPARIDPTALRSGSLDAVEPQALPLLPQALNSLPMPLAWGGAWTDSDLVQLARDTRPYTPGGDWYDIRPHLLVLTALAWWVCWPDPSQAQPIRPPVCVEIGVREAPSTLAILTAMRETGGTLYSVDSDPDAAAIARGVVEQAGLADWWRLTVCDSDAFGFDDTIDLLWLDGDHSYEQVCRDLSHFLPLVRPDGFAVLHDYYAKATPQASDGEVSGVAQAVEELRAQGGYEVLTLPWAFGLTLVRVLG